MDAVLKSAIANAGVGFKLNSKNAAGASGSRSNRRFRSLEKSQLTFGRTRDEKWTESVRAILPDILASFEEKLGEDRFLNGMLQLGVDVDHGEVSNRNNSIQTLNNTVERRITAYKSSAPGVELEQGLIAILEKSWHPPARSNGTAVLTFSFFSDGSGFPAN